MDERSGIEREKRMRKSGEYEPLPLPTLDAELASDRQHPDERYSDGEEWRALDTASHASSDED